MIANSFKSVGRVLTVAVAAMGLYLVTSQVAAERTELERVNRQIVAAKKDIRRLHTELGTRANLRQLERWNGEVLALTTPDADQFVMEEAQLASLDRSGITPGPRYAPAAMVTAMVAIPDAALEVPVAKPAPVATAANSATPAAPAQRMAMVKDVAGPARVGTAVSRSSTKPAAQALARADAPKPVKPVDRAKAEKEQQLARLETKLLDDSLMGELARTAHVERGGRRAP